MRILAIDYGRKRVGIAITDSSGLIPQGVGVVPLSRALSAIKKIVKDKEVDLIVLGFPLNMDGTKSVLCDEVEGFGAILEKETGIKVVLWDERLTSWEADHIMKEAGLSWRKRKEKKDMLSAVLILKSFLEKSKDNYVTGS